MALAELLAVGDYGRQNRQHFWMKSDRRSHSEILVGRPRLEDERLSQRVFSHPDYDGHEALLFAQDTASGLRALIAIHDTTLGPAFGGCRMYPYASEQHAMTDVLRLSRGMTYKAAICELPYGGGKSVIIADPRRDYAGAATRDGSHHRGPRRPLHRRR